MEKGIWNNKEVEDLFKNVEEIKSLNKPLKDAFKEHAEKYGRKPNSVRNYYYHEIDNLEKDKKRLNKIGINLEKHKKLSITYFSKQEESELLNKMEDMVKNGTSVRKACYILADGDANKMLRFQNKYRNSIYKSNENKHIEKGSIIKFTSKKNVINDSEFQALFMGIIRLIKRHTSEEYEEKLKLTKVNFENKERKFLTEVNKIENENKNLKDECDNLKIENQKLSLKMMKLQCEKASQLKAKLYSKKQEIISNG